MMNIDDILRDTKTGSLIDHDWYGEGLVDLDMEGGAGSLNNSKPEMEFQWDTTAGFSFSDEENVVQNPDSPKVSGDRVVKFARDLMNQGLMGKELSREIRAKFAKEEIAAEKNELQKQLALEGIVGCIAVDGRGYKDCKEAMMLASNSPNKNRIKYVIGCGCGDFHMLPGLDDELVAADSPDNAIDAFMEDTQAHKAEEVSHCRSTMLPVVARMDFDDEDVDETMIDLINFSGLPEGVASEIKARTSSNCTKLKMAFMAAYKLGKADESKYAEKVDASEFMIDRGEGEIPLDDSVDFVAQEVDGSSSVIDIELNEIDIELNGKMADDFDVDPNPEYTGIFEGSDEIDVNEASEREPELDVNPYGDLEIDL